MGHTQKSGEVTYTLENPDTFSRGYQTKIKGHRSVTRGSSQINLLSHIPRKTYESHPTCLPGIHLCDNIGRKRKSNRAMVYPKVTQWPQPNSKRIEMLVLRKFTLSSLKARSINAQAKVYFRYSISILLYPKQITTHIAD